MLKWGRFLLQNASKSRSWTAGVAAEGVRMGFRKPAPIQDGTGLADFIDANAGIFDPYIRCPRCWAGSSSECKGPAPHRCSGTRAQSYFDLMAVHEKLAPELPTTRNYLRVALCNIHERSICEAPGRPRRGQRSVGQGDLISPDFLSSSSLLLYLVVRIKRLVPAKPPQVLEMTQRAADSSV